jgi:hypothetical protein
MAETGENIHPHCRAFVAVVEDLLAHRWQEAVPDRYCQQAWNHDPWEIREMVLRDLSPTILLRFAQQMTR